MSNKTKRVIGGILAGLLILTTVGNWVEDAWNRSIGAAVEQVQEAEREAVQAMAMAESALEIALEERARADSLEDVAARSTAVAQVSKKQAADAKAAYQRAVVVSLGTPAFVVAAADSVIAALETTVVQLESSNADLEAANARLHVANDTLVTTVEAQQKALEKLRVAANNLVDASQPSFFQRVLPKPGIGVGVGLDGTGRLTAVVGVTIGWRM